MTRPIDVIKVALLLAVSVAVVSCADPSESPSNQQLSKALSVQDYDTVREAIRNGADLDLVWPHGLTPLQWCAGTGDAKAIEVLIEAGAGVNVQNHHGTTALHLAAEFGRAEVAGALLAAGADASIRDLLGRTPLDLARENEHSPITALLQQRDPGRTPS